MTELLHNPKVKPEHLARKAIVYLRQTRVSGSEGGRRGATSTSGSDDPKRMRRRANGRSDTRRSDRSHGPRSSSGLSRGGEKRQ